MKEKVFGNLKKEATETKTEAMTEEVFGNQTTNIENNLN
jgi:hypothetical protein